MNRNKLTFKDENITVDWIGFKFQNLDNFAQTKLAEYLFKIGFNSYQESGKLAKPIKESILVSSKNKFQVLVVHEAPYWKGTSVYFSGASATFFYSLVKQTSINWEFFSSAILGRFDLNYVRKNKTDDKISVRQFLENCQTKLMQTNKNISLEKNSKGLMFDLKNSYCDWLLANFRQVKKPPVQEVLINSLSTSYLTEKPMDDLTKVEFFYRLIQLLNYIKCLEGSSKSISLGDRTYKTFQFPVNSFLEFLGKPKNNHYQVKKLVEFLKSLQTIEPILENFSDGGFRRYVAFPYLKVKRKKCWWVELSICEELYLYRYPFYLPETFLNYRDNFELKVKFTLLQSFCKISVQKEFPTQEFLSRVSISTSKSAKLKNYIVRVLHDLKDLKVIEPGFKILTKQNQLKEVSTLTSNLVSRSKSIFYTENINN